MLPKHKERIADYLAEYPFRPAWWLPGAHAQTLSAPFLPKPGKFTGNRETLETPDGDILNLFHFPADQEDRPLVILLHGLEGSGESQHVRRILEPLKRAGWGAVILEFRGCGGRMNRLPRYYHSGDTGDIAFVVGEMRRRFPERPIYAVGFSLGGNVLAKWLGETGEHNPLDGASLISAPFDLAATADFMDRSLFGIYTRSFLSSLIPKARAKERQHPGSIDLEQLQHCSTVRGYDEIVTARLHGFDGADDYYEKSSCGPFLSRIRVPTLVIAAENDPLVPADTIPRPTIDESDFLFADIQTQGGHLGFVQGSTPFSVRFWAEDQTVRFFRLLERISLGQSINPPSPAAKTPLPSS